MRPLVNASVEPKLRAGAAKLHYALARLAAEDATFSFHTDAETGQTIMHGLSEAQLDGHIDILRRIYHVEANFGRKQVAYLETLGCRAEMKYTHKRQAGGSGQYAEIKIVFEPLERDAGIVFENKVVGGVMAQSFIPAIEKGIRLQAETGVLAGFPTVDFKFTLIDGRYHDMDSSALAFEIAAKACFRELRTLGSPKVLEPVMRLEVLAPREYAGNIVNDLNNRRSQNLRTEARGDRVAVVALVPLAKIFGYADALRTLSQGRAQFTMQYDSYQEVPLPEPPDDLFPSGIAMRA